MNPRERLLTTLRGGTADRVPLILHGLQHVQLDEIKEPAKHEIVERVIDQMHFVWNVPSYVNRYLVTPPQRIAEVDRQSADGDVTITCAIDTPRGKLTAVTGENAISQTTWTIKYPVETLDDIEKIRCVPWELPAALKSADLSKLPPEFEQRGILCTHISSPFVCVAGMMSYERFWELCTTHFGFIKELTEQCCDRIADVLDVLLADRRIEYVWIGGCEWLTPPMGSPRLYEELVQPYEKKLIERIHAGGALAHVHCHGNVRSTIERVIERGADFFEPVEPPPDGEITMAEAKSIVNGRMTLGGNVECRVLENESVDEVERAARAAFEGGKERMVFATGAGPISAFTPRMSENYGRVIDVWERLSPIP